MYMTVNWINELEDPRRLSYKDLWLQSRDGSTMCVQKVQDMLELFAFGTMDDVGQVSKRDISELMLKKLRKLSVISLLQFQKVRLREISYQDVKKVCQWDDASDEEVERILVELHEFAEIEIDSVDRVFRLKRLLDSRDVYCGEFKLRIVAEKDVLTKDKLLDSLVRWRDKLNKDVIGYVHEL